MARRTNRTRESWEAVLYQKDIMVEKMTFENNNDNKF